MSTTDPTPTVTEPATEAPSQMSAPPVDSPLDSTPAPLTADDWTTILAALRTWHRSPDSRLHLRARHLADRIDAGAR